MKRLSNCQLNDNFFFLRVCKCPLSPKFDLKEAVDQNLQTAKENQKIVKEGKKWLKTLYEALKEKHPHRSYDKEDEDEAEVDETDDDDDITNRNYGNYLDIINHCEKNLSNIFFQSNIHRGPSILRNRQI